MPSRQVYVDAANTALGVLAAKSRGAPTDVDRLLASFEDEATMASGFFLAAELLLVQLEQATQRTAAEIITEATLMVESRYPEPPAT